MVMDRVQLHVPMDHLPVQVRQATVDMTLMKIRYAVMENIISAILDNY